MKIVFVMGTLEYSGIDEEGAALSSTTIDVFHEASREFDSSVVFVSMDPILASKSKNKITMKILRQERPRVIAEIESLNPDAVICCGPVATACVFGKGNMSEERTFRRRFYPFGEDRMPVFCTFTPERARYTHDMKRLLLNDIKWAVEHIDRTVPERVQPEYKLIRVGDPEWRDRPYGAHLTTRRSVIGFDLETYPAISPFDSDARIRMVVLSYLHGSFADGDIRTFVIQCGPDSTMPEWVEADLRNTSFIKTGSNIKFDVRWCKRFGYMVKNYRCTALRESILDSSSPRTDLKFLAFSYAPELGAYNHALEERLDVVKDFRYLTDEELYDYAACDGVASLKAYFGQEARDTDGLLSCPGAKLLYDLYECIAQIEYNGIGVDLNRLDDLSDNYRAELATLRDTITMHLGPVNIDSATELAKILSEKVTGINLKPNEWRRLLTASTEDANDQVSTAREVLLREAWRHPAIPLIIEYRKVVTRFNMFIKAVRTKHLMQWERSYCIFPSYNISTGTYRLASSNPNGMNMPRETDNPNLSVKSQFIGRECSRILEIDLSQIEIRVAAALSGDPIMVEALRSGGDIHTQMASRMLGKQVRPDGQPADDGDTTYVTKSERQSCKTRTFLILYGGGAKKLSADLRIPKPAAQQMIDEYFATFRVLKEYIDSVHAEAQRLGYISTPFGLRRYFVPPVEWQSRAGYAIRRQAFNTKIQHTAAMIMYALMIELRREANPHVVQQVHDSLAIEVFDAYEESRIMQAIKTICDSMWRRLEGMGMTMPREEVPITFEATIGRQLGINRERVVMPPAETTPTISYVDEVGTRYDLDGTRAAAMRAAARQLRSGTAVRSGRIVEELPWIFQESNVDDTL